MLKRAYAQLTVRAVTDGEDERVFEGWATTPATDRMDDIVDPMGAKFKNPLPLLHQHDSDRPIGTVRFKKATPEGIEFEATIPKIAEPGPLQDRVNTAWGEIKAGLVRAVSIGFRILEGGIEALGNGGFKFTAIEIMELSAVTIPANAEATITNIRSFDVGAKAASGLPVVKVLPGVSGSPPKPQARKGAAMPRTIAEQIEDFTKTIAQKDVRRNEIATSTGDRGETMDAAEAEEFDTLTAEIKAAGSHLERLRSLEVSQAATATAVTRAAPDRTGSLEAGVVTADHRVEPQVRAADRSGPGIRMARAARIIVLSRLAMENPTELARAAYPNDPAIIEVVRAASPAAITNNPTWAGALVGEAGAIIADFIEYLRPQTILGKFGQNGIPDLTRVPFYAALIGQTSGGHGYWVGEGKAKPLTSFDFSRKSLTPLKVANIAVLSDEIIRSSNPAVEPLIRDALVAALRERLDIDFVDPAKVAVPNISPASITNGVPPIASVGGDAESVRADIKAAITAYTANNNTASGGVWIMPTNLAMSLGMMVNLLGQPEFPGISRTGGNLSGFGIIPSDYVPADTVVLANAPEIYLGDEGGFAVDMSREASLEMSDAPTSSSSPVTAATAPMVSLWQTNSVGLRAERTINWMKRRPEAVVVLDGVTWGDATAP
jgi:HK97 family phage major capsid protein/HK97 family phage prohead protease